jgi:hypothetical protein
MARWLVSVNDKALNTHQFLVGDVRSANTPSPIVNTAEDCGFCTAQTALNNDHFAQLAERMTILWDCENLAKILQKTLRKAATGVDFCVFEGI